MTTRPELFLVLNHLTETDWKSEDELLQFVQSKAPDVTDAALLRRVMDYAITAGVLSRTGTLITRRRPATEATARGFEAATLDLPDNPQNTDPTPLLRRIPQLEDRVQTLETQVREIMATRDTGGVHWLQLHPGQMPRPLYDTLRARSLAVVGKGASDYAIATQMNLVAAQIIQLALRPN